MFATTWHVLSSDLLGTLDVYLFLQEKTVASLLVCT